MERIVASGTRKKEVLGCITDPPRDIDGTIALPDTRRLNFPPILHSCANPLRVVHGRDSKLTRLLKDSLGGNCRTVMIANIR